MESGKAVQEQQGRAASGRFRRRALVLVVAAVLLFFVSLLFFPLRPAPSAATVRHVDALNDSAYALRYACPDSSLLLARRAARLAEGYDAGMGEALNHQIFVCILHMDYVKGRELYHELQSVTGNQIELLVGEVNMMMICCRAAQNRTFFDYYNRAKERMARIMEEYDDLKGRDRLRLDYALVEFRLAVAFNCVTLMQEEGAERALDDIDPDGYVRQDRALLSFYYYLRGMAVAMRPEGGMEQMAEAFDYWMWAYISATHEGYVYLQAQAEQLLASLLASEQVWAYMQAHREGELDYLCLSVLHDEAGGRPVPALQLAMALARQAQTHAGQTGCLLLEARSSLAQGQVLIAGGDYGKALHALEEALELMNHHHLRYYPDDGRQLKTFDNPDLPGVDMLWARDPDVQTVPLSLAYIRESLSVVFAALGDKQKSDYNRNLYLDLLDFTRQDKSLESRVAIAARDNQLLHTLLGGIILLFLLLGAGLYAYARKWKRRGVRQLAMLKDMSEWFMEAPFTDPREGPPALSGTGSRTEKEKRILRDILRPYAEWMEKNRVLSGRMDEERTQLREEYLACERQIAAYKRRNISRRAKVSLVHAIMPLVDRMLYTARNMERKECRDARDWNYVGELADEINRRGLVLTEWIRMNRGEVELTVETFPLQPLFQLLEKGRYNFVRCGIDFRVEDTDLKVKADKALTFFMLNTLVDNARKFTPPGGRVEVKAEAREGAVEIAVSDTGCGLSEDDVRLLLSSKVYDARKVGADSPDAGRKKGSGFGLMNCRGIIEKYRKCGDLFSVCRFDIWSRKGEGSRFSFRLPEGMAGRGGLLSVLLLWLGLCGSAAAAPAPQDGLASAVSCADSVYFANIRGDYAAAMQWADSAFVQLSGYYAGSLPDSCTSRRLTLRGRGLEELEWLREGVEADYHLIMGIRNEMAVAALALHEWDVYAFNNRQFAHLYRLLTRDDTLVRFHARQRETQVNLSVSIVLLVLMFLVFMVLAYLVYFRRRILFRFNAMKVLEVNRAMLQTAEAFGHSGNTDELMNRMLAAICPRLRELHEVEAVRVCLYRQDGRKMGTYALGGEERALQTDALLEQAYRQEVMVCDENSGLQAYPLLLRGRSGENKLCIGAIGVDCGTYRMRREDFIFESYVVIYLALMLYETVIQHGRELEDVEAAENEKQRSLYERARLKVQNQILDNCLSAIKHESMYYPSRIKQIVKSLSAEDGAGEVRGKVRSLRELAEYYKEIYTLLCARADRQVDTVPFKGERLSVRKVAGWWLADARRRVGARRLQVELAFDDRLPRDMAVFADVTLLDFMLELLTKEWLSRLEGGEACRMELRTEEDGKDIRFTLALSVPLYTPEEAGDIFSPDMTHYTYLLCKEIISELNKMNNYGGCRIELEAHPGEGCRIWFTLPEYK